MSNLTKEKRSSYLLLFSEEAGAVVITDWCCATAFRKMLDLCNLC